MKRSHLNIVAFSKITIITTITCALLVNAMSMTLSTIINCENEIVLLLSDIDNEHEEEQNESNHNQDEFLTDNVFQFAIFSTPYLTPITINGNKSVYDSIDLELFIQPPEV